MEPVAVDLKQEREKKKISLAQIAADTRISLRYLQSIEEGRYGDLPGGVYNRSFIKAYCESINLDPHQILERYDAEVESSIPEKSNKAALTLPPRNSFSIPTPILIWSVMLLISAIGLFFSRGWISERFSPYFSNRSVADVRDQTSATPTLYPESESADTPSVPVSKSPVKTGLSPEVEVGVQKPNRSTNESMTTSVMEPIPAGKTVESKLRLEIIAKEQCWISVDADGQPTSRRLMEPGEERVFSAAERLFILIGNAGGVQLKLNGQPTKPLGNQGEVIKMNVDLENLQQFLDKSAG